MESPEEADEFDTVGEYRRTLLARRMLPSEIRHKKLLKWPADVEALTGISDGLLRARQAKKDAPKLTYIGRQTFVRPCDLIAWIDAKAEEAA